MNTMLEKLKVGRKKTLEQIYAEISGDFRVQHEGIVAGLCGPDADQERKLRQGKRYGMPNGFFKTYGRGGTFYGIGFHCPNCRIEVKQAKNGMVQHCGRVDHEPNNKLLRALWFFFLPRWVPRPTYLVI
jgi:hypothetical protein